MTINELVKQLQEYRKYMGGDAEVRMITMTQAQLPLEFIIAGITSGEEINDDPDAEDDDDAGDDNVVYIVEGQYYQIGSHRAKKLIG